MEKHRDIYFDFLRGIAIAMVVAIHTYTASPEISSSMFIRQSLNCAVPIFLAISGYFIGKKDLSTLNDYLAFLKMQFFRVYVPMLLWSIPWLLMDLKNEGVNIEELRIFVGGYSVFYFIILIMQCYLLTPLIKKMSLAKSLIVCGGLSFVGITLFVYMQDIQQMHIPMYISSSPFFLWIIFYTIGVKLQNGCSYRFSFVLLLALFLVLSVGETYYYWTNGKIAHGIKISTHFYSVFFVLLMFSREIRNFFVRKIENKKVTRYIAWIGRQSFFIYLCHMIVVHYINEFGLFQEWFVRWGMGLFLATGASFICKKIFRKKMNYILGN